uniref:Ecdysoneless homolog (Drosophila) n=1 Tax=Salarias fasciatus TaxID=181472 RepID=A0A672JLQ8_SALFA
MHFLCPKGFLVMQEDVVQYKLFLIQSECLSSQQTQNRLTHLTEEILAKVAPLLMQYIWQHQPFNLKYHPEKCGVPAHIGGSTQFGDNVEDEWFIVYLLQQITKDFPELAARVEDNDGEFLLIEAADYLPKWLNPDTSENRVFIYQGELHIIPSLSKSSSVGFPKDVVPGVEQALALLSTNTEACLASPKIRTAVRKRIAGYPEKIKAGLHHAHCYIPAGIASVLAQRPDLVAPAVSAFYLRDPVDLQACRRFKTFPPDTRVLTMVTFSRCLYAQLQQQQFTPDRRSGFTLPPRSHPQYRAHELGMKLAHGFEILCSKCRTPSSEPDAPVSCNPQWKGFMASLKKNNYFRGELEGSARHKQLTRSAENFFKQSVVSTSSVLTPGEEILRLLQDCDTLAVEELKKQESQLPQEDSEAKEGEDSEEEEVAGYSLVAVSQGMKSFLNTMSSHEGAELPWSSSAQPFNVDPESISSALDKLLGGKAEELDSDDLDDDDDDDEDDDEVDDKVKEEDDSSGNAETDGTQTLDSLKSYMDQMDEELMNTNIGQSFSQTNYNKKASDSSRLPPFSFGDGFPAEGDEGETEEPGEIQPLDVDFNLVSNLMESLSCQAGLAGPASNLLQSLGVHLPPNSDPA